MTHIHSYDLQLGPDGHGLLYGNFDGYVRLCKCGEYSPDYVKWLAQRERRLERTAARAPVRPALQMARGGYELGASLTDDGPLANTERLLHGQPMHGIPLSSREIGVLDLLTQGYTQIEVARLLGISYQTAKNHTLAILCKTGAPNTTRAAVIYALATRAVA